MAYKMILLLVVAVGLMLFSAGAFVGEGTLRGPALAGRLAVKTGGRTATLRAHCYRPNRTYYLVSVR